MKFTLNVQSVTRKAGTDENGQPCIHYGLVGNPINDPVNKDTFHLHGAGPGGRVELYGLKESAAKDFQPGTKVTVEIQNIKK